MDKTKPPTYTAPARIRAILAELNRVAMDYTEARSSFEEARTHFEAAREKFSAVKGIAAEVLSWTDLYNWEAKNPNIKFAGMAIGEAIVGALREKAVLSAIDVAGDPKHKFSPATGIDGIVEALELGGFEFKTATTKREVNGALMKLAGIHKIPNSGLYEAEDAYEILETIAGKNALAEATNEEEVPF